MYQNEIYICFLDIATFSNFGRKNAEINTTQGVCHVIHILFQHSLHMV